MIIWINGAFGVGKTTTAALLRERLPGARMFDPEYVGHLLTAFVDAPTGDFQDLPLWRRLTVQTLTGLTQEYDHPWIVPMSLVDPAYRTEILNGLRAAGVPVREFVLTLPEADLRARIDADLMDPGARTWRDDHVEQALTAFEGLTDAEFLDASPPADEVAGEIIRRLLRT